MLEEAAVEADLASMAMTGEADRVQVDPSQSRGRELDARRAPVGLDLIAESAKRRDRRCLLLGIDREVQVAVLAGPPADERVNSPAPLTGPRLSVHPV